MALEISFCFSGRVEISLAIQQQGKQICDKYVTKGGGIQYDYSLVIDFQWYQIQKPLTSTVIRIIHLLLVQSIFTSYTLYVFIVLFTL